MISYLKGTVAAKNAYGAIIDVGGVGWELSMSTKALASLPDVGEQAQVWTYLQVKDDGMALFGFADLAEKEMFTRLIGVSGIGPKMGVAALSTFKPSELAAIIADGDVVRISTVPGIGKKTAQRVVLELQGILKSEESLFNQPAQAAPGAMKDASEALKSMGFAPAEISAALKGYSGSKTNSSDIIRYALKNMGGR